MADPSTSQTPFKLEDLPPPAWRGFKPRVGDVCGGFRLISCLKDGDQGLVFTGVHEVTRRRAVLKFPIHEAVWNGIASASLEAMLLAQLRIPEVVRVLHAGRYHGLPYLVLEAIEGETLDDRLVREGRLSARTASRLLRESAMALSAVHARGILHGDVKPANLMIPLDGPVRVIDFGLARFEGARGTPFGTDIVVGSPLYMSPEHATNRRLTPASDIYSLGASFYHALTGSPPFTGEDPDVLARRHLEQAAVPIRRIDATVPEGLARIVEGMLRKRPEDRPRSMAEVAAAVAAWEHDDRHAA